MRPASRERTLTAVQYTPPDPWDNALDAHLQQVAGNPRVLDEQPYASQEYLYEVEADSWTAPSQSGAGNVRHFTVWSDGMGTANIGEVGLMP